MNIPKFSAEYIINKLKMKPHPEGGFYSLSFEDPELFTKEKAFSNGIYFLIPKGDKSIFHSLTMSEIWLFHSGGPLVVHLISERGDYSSEILSSNLNHRKEQLSLMIPKGTWMGAVPGEGTEYSLVSCITAPGFCFEDDFILGERAHLLKQYPKHTEIIKLLTN